MTGDKHTILWRETISSDRVSSYLVTERAAAPQQPSAVRPTEALVGDLAELFFAAVPSCSWGLFEGTVEKPASSPLHSDEDAAERPVVLSASLHPAGLPLLSLIRFGTASLRRGREHALLVLPVTGGLLAGSASGSAGSAGLAPHRKAAGWELGALAFEVLRFGGRLSLSVQVCDFPSRLIGPAGSPPRQAVYRLTQSPVHRFLVGRYLHGAADRLAV
jgi:hypothetical protein